MRRRLFALLWIVLITGASGCTTVDLVSTFLGGRNSDERYLNGMAAISRPTRSTRLSRSEASRGLVSAIRR